MYNWPRTPDWVRDAVYNMIIEHLRKLLPPGISSMSIVMTVQDRVDEMAISRYEVYQFISSTGKVSSLWHRIQEAQRDCWRSLTWCIHLRRCSCVYTN